jgi:regulator of sigma E protease
MYVIIFIIILAVLVFIHELGHFLAAKSAGIRVDEFGLGFPPRIFGFKKGETVYSLNAIPFGGFVKIFGENPDEESIDGPDKSRSFVHKSKLIQIYVLVAGVACNIIFAWLLLSFGFMVGMPVPQDYKAGATIEDAKVTITSVSADSPAALGGLKTGDVVRGLKSGNDQLSEFTVEQVQNFTAQHPNQPILLSIERDGKIEDLSVTPKIGPVPDRATMGVTLDLLGTLKVGFFQAFWEGLKLTWNLIEVTVVGLAKFFSQIFVGKAQFSDVAGPVGIAGLVGDAARLGIIYLVTFTALISLNLAVINLIPFPALDGGRVLFVIIEKIKGSAIKPSVANAFNAIGFVLLILLMIVITFHDVIRLIHG